METTTITNAEINANLRRIDQAIMDHRKAHAGAVPGDLLRQRAGLLSEKSPRSFVRAQSRRKAEILRFV